jgi:hypothetical protein
MSVRFVRTPPVIRVWWVGFERVGAEIKRAYGSVDFPRWVIRYRSLRHEIRSMSAMPLKRRLAVKASSVAMGHLRTPAVHTRSEERLNQPGNLLGGFEVQAHQRLRRLAYAPEQWQHPRLHNAADILAPSIMTEKPQARGRVKNPPYCVCTEDGMDITATAGSRGWPVCRSRTRR